MEDEHEWKGATFGDPTLPRFEPLPRLKDGARIASQLLAAGYIEAAWFVVRTKNELVNAKYRIEEMEELVGELRRLICGRT